MIEIIKQMWKREPIRVLYILGAAAWLVYTQVKSGVGWDQAIEIAVTWAVAEFARAQVTPVSDPRLPE